MNLVEVRESPRHGSAGLLPKLTLVTGLLLPTPLIAGTIQVLDLTGTPVPNAVILLPGTATQETTEAVVDQKGKRFVPYVSVVPTGSWVRFPNSDDTRHSVYSFSDAKTFELKLYHANDADPILFDKAGLVTLGCNVHDHMKAYVVVTDRQGVVTDERGQATISLPFTDSEMNDQSGGTMATKRGALEMTFQLWHPQLPDLAPITLTTTVTATDGQLTLPIKWDNRDPQASKSRSELENKFKSFKRNAD